ncbi:MAG TPA: hypothetical protein VJK29_08880, partial [Terriglobales bacterium]|nr:hypothetical protein [Terriglobales bacterium]
ISVTALGMFNSAGTKKLRASTYGRGVWEFTLIAAPDFQFVVANNPLTVFAGQSGVFNGTLQALNGYASLVNLSCGNLPATAPPTCSVTPSALTPTISGTPFTVNTSGPVAEYLFNVHGVGTDANTVTHDFALALHVVDFNLTTPAPASVTVSNSNSSAPVSFQVTAAGSFNAAMALSCTGLPAGAACNFQPSSSVNPTSAIPVAVTLTISTTTSTPVGTFPITIAANAAGAPSQKTQNLSLVVVAPDFSVTNTSGAQTVNAGTTATYGLNFSPIGASTFTNAVTYSCAASGLPTLSTCSFIPTQIAGGTAATNVTLSIATTAPPTGTPPGNYTITVTATSGSLTHSTQAALTVAASAGFDFTIINNTSPVTIKAGQQATYNLDVAPTVLGETFPNHVSLACSSGLPALSTCSFSPTQVASGSGTTNVVLSITTTAPIPVSARSTGTPLYAGWSLLPGLLLAFGGLRHRRLHGKRLASCLSLMVFALLLCLGIACGGGLQGGGGGGAGQPGTPQGNYAIMVSATSGSITHTVQVALTVTP